MAILAGDAMLTYSFEHIARATQGVPAERVLRVIAELGRASGADGLVGGQVVDIQSEGKEVGGLAVAGRWHCDATQRRSSRHWQQWPSWRCRGCGAADCRRQCGRPVFLGAAGVATAAAAARRRRQQQHQHQHQRQQAHHRAASLLRPK